jgi:hypothetical protein
MQDSSPTTGFGSMAEATTLIFPPKSWKPRTLPVLPIDQDPPACPWCDRQDWEVCQEYRDTLTCINSN